MSACASLPRASRNDDDDDDVVVVVVAVRVMLTEVPYSWESLRA